MKLLQFDVATVTAVSSFLTYIFNIATHISSICINLTSVNCFTPNTLIAFYSGRVNV